MQIGSIKRSHTHQVKVDVALKEKGNADRLYKEVTYTQHVDVAL